MGIGLIGVACLTIAVVLVQMRTTGLYGIDGITYLAAGERLNVGHQLYSLEPGDRAVLLNPPQWTTPLVSSPTIAAYWRLLAALPNELGLRIWWLGSFIAFIAAVLLLGRRQPLATGIALCVLVLPSALQIGTANLNGIVLLSTILAWRAFAAGRDTTAGAITGALAVFKLTPTTLIWWLVAVGRWRAVGASLAVAIALLLGGVALAGVDAHMDYFDMLRNPASMGVYPDSLAGVAIGFGLAEPAAEIHPVGVRRDWPHRYHPPTP